MVCLVLLLLPVLACRSDAIDVATSYQGKILKSDVLDDAVTEEWTELTLDALADLCVSFNTDPGWDTIFGFYFPGVDLVKKSATLMISDELGLYYIAVKQDGELRVLCNQHGYPFYANLSSVTAYWLSLIKIQLADINDKIVPLLQSIDTRLQNTFTRVAAIYTNTSRFLSNIDETSKDINTQFRDFVNGHTVDDLIGAIENISGGDHSGIVSLLGQIDDHLTAGLTSVKSAIEGITIPANPAYDDTSLRALVSSIDKKLDELPGGSVTADLQPVVDAVDRLNENVSLISTLSVHKLFGVSVVPATSGLRYRDGVFTYWITPDPILTMTALVVICTLYAGNGPLAHGAVDGISKTNMAQLAFSSVFGETLGNAFVAICLLFFAFSTIVGWNLFGRINVNYLFGKKANLAYSIIAIIFIFLGSCLSNDLVWELTDMFNQLMVLPNMIALVALSGIVAVAARKYNDEHELRK